MTYKAKLKVVPNETPNADGHWIDVVCDDELVEMIKAARSFNTMVELFKSLIPLGHHIVQTDLKCILELRPATKTLRFEDDQDK